MVKKKDVSTTQKYAFTCFICHQTNLEFSKFEIHEHESLQVTCCKPCYESHVDVKDSTKKWHGSSEWEMTDESGKQVYCEICAEGGELLACDEPECCKSFCTKCLAQWLGSRALEEIMEDSQIPFVCFCSIDKEDIQEIFPFYHRFRQLSKKFIKEKAAYELISENGYISDENVGLAIKKAVKHTKTTQKSSTSKIKKFTCFSCFEKCDMSKEHLPFVHKKFNVALCSSCWGFLNGDPSEWTMTDGKNDYCVVSGEGGDIVSCDKCENSFTTDVLKKWLTKKQFDHLMENWIIFLKMDSFS